ncbi:hypothetical protein APR50_10475 [Variovorax paradoxus]|jgi:GNAT superfamily N-acetyltransferase|uniref:GNAT family N-acetyltransferase n=1 Tax=Variovorax paradoxus TaxID=34073 RepID=UPI0006E509DB|nr:hypothetical protein APR52_20725 [Variovorax paradoxus]KPV08888.1 hypothetical protein APR50_10475 [Variovorax paradoxus]KPV11385.1 hypothetical protein APR49_09350 [Variovorax paradoxus]KPV23277.1 hypothetical protein APR51_07925 [Variovorax paradoxus]KPV31157.1 hypothetical protein APR48_17680 [Variovorax paradoxus]
MRVREATEADLAVMIEMGRALHAESPRYSGMAFSPRKLTEVFHQLHGTLLVPAGCAFVAESEGYIVGMTVGTIASRWFSEERYLTDLTLYVRPEVRASLLGGRAFRALVMALEQWGAEQGVSGPVLGVSTEIHAEQTVRAYERMGYRLAGYTMVKNDGH